ncbi:hypothetical protein LL251_09105 [Sphingobium naphthae]|nr:hypothetical protein [Sphingobium naphthae]
MKSFKLVILFPAIALAACGPIHPRWKNEGSHDISVTYWRGADHYGVRIKQGREAVPPAPFDFQTVERIEIIDAGQRYRFGRPVILKLHDQCGNGYGCWISYDAKHELHVSTSNARPSRT